DLLEDVHLGSTFATNIFINWHEAPTLLRSSMNHGTDNLTHLPPKQEQAPQVAGIRFGPGLAAGLYLLLVAAAVLALWARRWPGELPGHLEAVAPWLFLAFVLVFAIYRL